MRILVRGGLSNRLRTIIGFWFIADKTNDTCQVIWKTNDPTCNGRWEDIFQTCLHDKSLVVISRDESPHEDYNFAGHSTIAGTILSHAKFLLPADLQHTKTTFEDVFKSQFHKNLERTYYSRLPIRHDLMRLATEYIEKTFRGKPFVAVHIRRSDHTVLAKSVGAFTTCDEFDEFIVKHANKGFQTYLATDDIIIQEKYRGTCCMYKPICVATAKMHLRQTSLQHAMVDILIASHAVHFKGSGYSSYSKLIHIFQRHVVKNMTNASL